MTLSILKGYLELTKVSIMTLVLITTTLGYFMAQQGFKDPFLLLFTLLGAALTCGGSAALNHYLERDSDLLMNRTKKRPIPTGLITPNQALCFGIILVLAGIIILYTRVNLLTAFLSLLTAFLYVLVYTPLKKVSWLNTLIGAIPGAIPPMGGWAAARGELGFEAWVLFLILFAWQHPHFFAIAWMYKDDYRAAGFKMLPVIYPDGKLTFIKIVCYSFLLIAVSMLPSMIGMSGKLYLAGALILGFWMLHTAFNLYRSHTVVDARRLLKASVIYLPLLLLLIILDVNF